MSGNRFLATDKHSKWLSIGGFGFLRNRIHIVVSKKPVLNRFIVFLTIKTRFFAPKSRFPYPLLNANAHLVDGVPRRRYGGVLERGLVDVEDVAHAGAAPRPQGRRNLAFIIPAARQHLCSWV